MLKWIRLRETLSGGRCDGRPWPPGGELIDVPDWEAEHAVNAGWAYYEDPPPGPEPEVVVVTVPVPVPVPALEVNEAGHPAGNLAPEPAAPAEPEPEPEPEPEVAEPPRPSDPKTDWVEYAVARGMDEDKATAMSKADLMSRYGGRL